MSKVEVLSEKEINNIIKRLSYEILENNYQSKKIILAGINNNGLYFAELIKKQLEKIATPQIELINIRLKPSAPLEEITISVDPKSLKNQTVIIIDDVANTGRTIFYAFKPFLEILTKSVQVAVLVDRMHKSYPIKVDFLGLSLATTLKENITVNLKKIKSVVLE